MNCQRVREELWPPERPRLCEAEVAEAQAHVEGCEDCRLYFAQDRALLDVYSRVRRDVAPRSVREGVFDALARARLVREGEVRARRRVGRRTLLGVGLALAASVAILVTGVFPDADAPTVDDPGIFAEDYLRRAVGQDQMVSSDAQEVRRFIQRELGMSLAPLQMAGLEIERVESCLIQGRRGVLIVYRTAGGPISHYLVPWDGSRARAPAVADYHSGPAGDQMPVVTWSTPQVEQALVGEVEARELMRIAALGAT